MPGMSFAFGDYISSNRDIIKTSNLKLEDAEILVMMNSRGILQSSHTIHNLKDEEVFLITVIDDNILRTYLVEQDEKIELVEEYIKGEYHF